MTPRPGKAAAAQNRPSRRPPKAKSGPAPAADAGLAARRLAVDTLVEVVEHRRPLEESFERLAARPEHGHLEPRDRAFARLMVTTALRRHGQVADALARYLVEPLPAEAGLARQILANAATQILFLGTPRHAAVDMAVRQCRLTATAARYARLANAVLRRIADDAEVIKASQDETRLALPNWLWSRWVASYGEAATRAIVSSHLHEPALDLSVKSDPEGWAARLGAHLLASGSLRLAARGRIADLDGYAEGGWWVQDAAAALPARLLGDVRDLAVADLCASPGGKTAQLAAAGGRVVAVEVSERRLRRIAENLARLKLTAELVNADAAEWQPGRHFDRVLLDAPCLATGTARRHPDVLLLKTPNDLAALVRLQRRLLDHAADLVAAGGWLVYCTCSLEPEEGEQQIRQLIERSPGLETLPIRPDEVAGHAEWLTPEGWLRTLPHQLAADDPTLGGLDGFFAARLLRR